MAASPTTRRTLLALSVAAVFLVIALALVVAPDARNFSAPLTHRIFYFHVPSAWVAYLAFGVTAFASARYLANGDMAQDRTARASAEIGTLFGAIALLTGLVWARVEFAGGYSPLKDAKVLTLLVLLLAYLAYLTLRGAVDDPARRARLSAVFGILAFLGVPLSYLASKMSVHPDFTESGQGLAPELGMILGTSVVMFTILYAYLLTERVHLEELHDRVHDLGGSL